MVVQREELKKRLEEERDRLQKEIRDLENQVPGRGGLATERDGGYGNHLADDASDTFEQEKMAALGNHLRGTLSSVEYALHQLETGKYGVCEECGREISEARLEALPHATLCIDCKARLEKEAQRRTA